MEVYLDHSARCGTPHTKFGEDILMSVQKCPQNEIFKNAPKRRNSTIGFDFDAWRLQGCHPAKFQWNRTISSHVTAILPFCTFVSILGPPLWQRISELAGPSPTRLVPCGTPTIDPWKVFLDLWKSPPVQNGGTLKRSGNESKFGSEFGPFPPAKKGRGGEIFF